VCAEIDARLAADDACLLLAFSGGGPTAYEAAQRLHALGRRVHVVLFDSAPSTKGRWRTAELDPTDDRDSAVPPTLRTASIRELPGALRRSGQFHWRQLQFRRLLRNPGPPSFEHERYRALKHIHSRANDAYEPEPAAFAMTLVQVEGSDALHRCGDLVPNLVVHEVAGEHKTMLLPPQVDELAPIVAAAASECAASDSGARR
jgi:thioesterase domain-containing protein